jgi:hypothetical protein
VVAVPGTPALDERPEAPAVARLAEVADLVDDDVVECLRRRKREPPVERDRAGRGARAPARRCPRTWSRANETPSAPASCAAIAPPRRRTSARAARSVTQTPSSPSTGRRSASRRSTQSRFASTIRSTSRTGVRHGTVSSAPRGVSSSRQRRARSERRISTSAALRSTFGTLGAESDGAARSPPQGGATRRTLRARSTRCGRRSRTSSRRRPAGRARPVPRSGCSRGRIPGRRRRS